ncbi:MAG TPA: hypothetical protein VJI98_00880 [Candidatus Nanoarchaeia archaeon]|nr:hypothetical protein [Candidatus Nanoarchaeia archaeon]
MNFVKKLKILTGRQLPEDQMKKAKAQVEMPSPLELALDQQSRWRTVVKTEQIYTEGIQYMREIMEWRYGTTPDASYGWRQPHTGYYPIKRELSRYDAEGKRTKVEVWKVPFNNEGYPR